MYTPIHFSTLQLHLGADTLIDAISHHESNYEKNFFPLNFDKILPQKDLTSTIKKSISRTFHAKLGGCEKPLSKLTWHLN